MKHPLFPTLPVVFALVALALATRLAAEDKDKSEPARQADGQPAAAAEAGERDLDDASKNKRLTLPAGAKPKENPLEEDRGGILRALEGLTEAAVTKDGFDDVVERFVDAD